MSGFMILRDKEKESKDNSPCQTSVQASVLKVQVEKIEEILNEHKRNTEKSFDSLDKKIETGLSGLKEDINKNFDGMKAALEKQEEKLAKVEEKVDNIKNSLTALIAKFGIVFSFLASMSMLGLNYLVEKLKG